ncbi:hypothetical protein CapIbe_003552 [Capra ibex]
MEEWAHAVLPGLSRSTVPACYTHSAVLCTLQSRWLTLLFCISTLFPQLGWQHPGASCENARHHTILEATRWRHFSVRGPCIRSLIWGDPIAQEQLSPCATTAESLL